MKVTDKIFQLKEEYNKLIEDSNGGWPDVMAFADLCRIRGKLSNLSLDLSKDASKYARDFVSSETSRKVAYFKEKSRLMSKGMTEDGVIIKSASAAEPFAESFIANLRIKEAETEGMKISSSLLLKQTNEVLKSINQDIAILRKEFESIHERD